MIGQLFSAFGLRLASHAWGLCGGQCYVSPLRGRDLHVLQGFVHVCRVVGLIDGLGSICLCVLGFVGPQVVSVFPL